MIYFNIASTKINERNGTGVSFLFGEDNEGRNVAYIREAKDVLKRLNSHLREKIFGRK